MKQFAFDYGDGRGPVYKSGKPARKPRRKGKSTASKALEIAKKNRSFINKTIENKQVNFQATNQNISSSGYADRRYLKLATGAKDGTELESQARIGNSITLLSQQFCFKYLLSAYPLDDIF